MKLYQIGLSLLSLGMVAALAGCGGGSSNGVLTPNNPTPSPTATNQRFNGQYTGNFAGVTPEGAPVNGSFEYAVSETGQIAGNIREGGFSDLPATNATGTIDGNGNITITARPTGSVSTQTGTSTLANGSAISSGTLIIRQSSNVVVNGIFASARAEATDNPFAGTYKGSFGGDSNVDITLTADKNGAVSGLITQPSMGSIADVGTIATVGTIDRAGNLSVRAIGTLTGQPSIVLLTTLTGKASTDNGTTSASGNFNTTANGQQNAAGSFTATRQ